MASKQTTSKPSKASSKASKAPEVIQEAPKAPEVTQTPVDPIKALQEQLAALVAAQKAAQTQKPEKAKPPQFIKAEGKDATLGGVGFRVQGPQTVGSELAGDYPSYDAFLVNLHLWMKSYPLWEDYTIQRNQDDHPNAERWELYIWKGNKQQFVGDLFTKAALQQLLDSFK